MPLADVHTHILQLCAHRHSLSLISLPLCSDTKHLAHIGLHCKEMQTLFFLDTGGVTFRDPLHLLSWVQVLPDVSFVSQHFAG